MPRLSRSFAMLISLPMLALAIFPAQAAIYTYTIDAGTVADFNDAGKSTNSGYGVGLSAITGTFTVDTASLLVTSSSVTLSSPAEDAGSYDLGGTIFAAQASLPGVHLLSSTFELSLAFQDGPLGNAHLSLRGATEGTGPSDGAESGNLTTGGITLMASSVPEPSTWAMMILGFCGLGWLGYRRAGRAVNSVA